ncbi:MAG: hypothetical protein Q9M28_03710 [Mariprofundaceae bacterium]|nr:hypothetical protein [Mariprofundaceae bacterium]
MNPLFIKLGLNYTLNTTLIPKLLYKGANCASPQVPASTAQASMKPSGQKNTYETKEKEPIGPWRVVALYKNGVFDSCGAILDGAAGELVMSRGVNAKEDYDRLHISSVTGNQSARRLSDNDKPTA